MKNQEEMIKQSVKWWLDYMDGTVDKKANLTAEENMKPYPKEKIEKLIEENNRETLIQIYNYLTIMANYRKKKDFYITQEQRRRLEIKLTALVKKELENKKIAYLYTDENGNAGGILAVAMYYSEIKNESEENNTISILPVDTEMFISLNKTDIRYNGSSPLSTLYEIDEEQKS